MLIIHVMISSGLDKRQPTSSIIENQRWTFSRDRVNLPQTVGSIPKILEKDRAEFGCLLSPLLCN